MLKMLSNTNNQPAYPVYSNLEQVSNLPFVQANSASYPQREQSDY